MRLCFSFKQYKKRLKHLKRSQIPNYNREMKLNLKRMKTNQKLMKLKKKSKI